MNIYFKRAYFYLNEISRPRAHARIHILDTFP